MLTPVYKHTLDSTKVRNPLGQTQLRGNERIAFALDCSNGKVWIAADKMSQNGDRWGQVPPSGNGWNS